MLLQGLLELGVPELDAIDSNDLLPPSWSVVIRYLWPFQSLCRLLMDLVLRREIQLSGWSGFGHSFFISN